MNEYQKQLVQNSFREVVPIADQAAALFYNRLFTLNPALRSLFSGNISQQGLKFMNTLKLAISGLDDLEKIIPALQQLGRSHANFGVEDAHYAMVGEALIWALEQSLGDTFTEEIWDAWAETYRLLSTVMREAAREITIIQD